MSVNARALVPRIVTPVAALLALLLLVELGLRAWGYDPLGQARGGAARGARALLLRPSAVPGLDYDLVPGYAGEVWGTSVRINSLGLRDREFPVVKPAGSYRILALGDSITFGNRLAVESTYPKRLEARFAGRRVEVLNLGVGGYDLLQEVLRLEQIGLGLDPDHVVLGYCINDAGVVSVNRQYVDRLAAYDSALYGLRVVQLLAVSRDRLDAAREVEESLEDEGFEPRNREWMIDVHGDAELAGRIERLRATLDGAALADMHRFLPWYTSEARIGKLRYAFERLAGVGRSHGFEVTVAIVPHLHEAPYADSYAIVYEIVRHEAERVGLEVLNLHDAFESAGFQTVRGNPIHPNERGHEILAERLHAHLVARVPQFGEPSPPPGVDPPPSGE